MLQRVKQLSFEVAVQLVVLMLGFTGMIAVSLYRVEIVEKKADANSVIAHSAMERAQAAQALAQGNLRNVEHVSEALSSTTEALQKIVDDLSEHKIEDAADSERIKNNAREIERVRQKIGG